MPSRWHNALISTVEEQERGDQRIAVCSYCSWWPLVVGIRWPLTCPTVADAAAATAVAHEGARSVGRGGGNGSESEVKGGR